jgi:uncharacterized membrane protein YtjA (UPF0391 family)
MLSWSLAFLIVGLLETLIVFGVLAGTVARLARVLAGLCPLSYLTSLMTISRAGATGN